MLSHKLPRLCKSMHHLLPLMGQWGGVQEEWAQECGCLAQACNDWVLRVHTIEKGLEGTIANVDAGFSAMERQQLPLQHKLSGAASEIGHLLPSKSISPPLFALSLYLSFPLTSDHCRTTTQRSTNTPSTWYPNRKYRSTD
jgi:hypothetical protein